MTKFIVLSRDENTGEFEEYELSKYQAVDGSPEALAIKILNDAPSIDYVEWAMKYIYIRVQRKIKESTC